MLTDADYRDLAEFRYQLRRFLQFSEQQAKMKAIEPHQHQALLALKGLPPGEAPTIGTLARRLLLRHHSAVELVNRLERGGLVERQRDDNDRRAMLVRLTRKGEAKLRALSVVHRAELQERGPALAGALKAVLGRASRSKTA